MNDVRPRSAGSRSDSRPGVSYFARVMDSWDAVQPPKQPKSRSPLLDRLYARYDRDVVDAWLESQGKTKR